MRKLSSEEDKIKRAIRDIVALDLLVSDRKLPDILFDRGFKTANNTPLDREYVAKLRDKIHTQAVREVDHQVLASRIVEFKEKNRLVFDRLIRIAFYTDDLKKEGIQPPSYRDQISALAQIVKLDLAVFNSEMDAGLFKRHIGTLEIEKRYRPLPPELKAQMLQAFINWGVIPREKAEEIKINATDNNKPADDSSPAIVVRT